MSAYKDYYKGQEEKVRRDTGRTEQKSIKRWCWKITAHVRFLSGRCMMEGCPDRHTAECIEDVRLVE